LHEAENEFVRNASGIRRPSGSATAQHAVVGRVSFFSAGLAWLALLGDAMKVSHALGFLAIGSVLGLIPQVAPGWCPPSGCAGTSTRELWLHTMSWLQIGLAASCLARRGLSVLASVMKYDPERRSVAVKVPAARMAIESVAVTRPVLAGEHPRTILSLPAGLLDQPRAA